MQNLTFVCPRIFVWNMPMCRHNLVWDALHYTSAVWWQECGVYPPYLFPVNSIVENKTGIVYSMLLSVRENWVPNGYFCFRDFCCFWKVSVMLSFVFSTYYFLLSFGGRISHHTPHHASYSFHFTHPLPRSCDNPPPKKKKERTKPSKSDLSIHSLEGGPILRGLPLK